MDKFEIAHQRLVEACDARSWRDDPENPDEPATIQAMQIALNLPKQEPPARTEVLEAAASAVVAVCLDERAGCLLYTSPSPRDATLSRMPSSA